MSSASPSRAELADALGRVLLTPQDAAGLQVEGSVSAVLVPLYLDAGGALRVIFTKRREDMRRHPGEVSFPGGRQDEGEDDLRRTALREAEEEIGLDPAGVELVGALPPTPTIATGYGIYPFVGLIEPGLTWAPSAGEVAAVLDLAETDLRAGRGRRRMTRRGMTFRTDVFVVGDELIWGATARILGDLLDRLDAGGAWADRTP